MVLMDVQMPAMDGLEATRRLVADAHATVVILTTFDLDEYVFEALRAGAAGFLLKNAPAEDLIHAVRTVASGDALLAPSVTRRVIDRFVRTPASTGGRATARPSERARAGGLAAGRRRTFERRDRRSLVLGEATVKTHIGSILAKLGLRDRVAAVIVAYQSGLADRG